jgi:hypothetical protein
MLLKRKKRNTRRPKSRRRARKARKKRRRRLVAKSHCFVTAALRNVDFICNAFSFKCLVPLWFPNVSQFFAKNKGALKLNAWGCQF